MRGEHTILIMPFLQTVLYDSTWAGLDRMLDFFRQVLEV